MMLRLVFATGLASAYAAPCYTGIAGANVGPSCMKNEIYMANKPKDPRCGLRTLSNKCVENNHHGGQGDGCPEDTFTGAKRDQSSCAGAKPDKKRDLDDSFDGTTNHCRWAPELNGTNAKVAACEADEDCTFNPENEMCSFSEVASQKDTAWFAQMGLDCKLRVENPEPADFADACATKGAGTLDVCTFNDGNGAPSKDIVEAGFEHGLFRSGAELENGGCGMIASFRSGFGSASAFGANGPDLLGKNCAAREKWEELAEHIGHTKESIEEYCTNFVPDSSAMAALAEHSPGAIIAAAKAGQFAARFPSLKDNLFIVVKDAGYGECLFTAGTGFGVAICACDGGECNNEAALKLIVDPFTGPMRLIQFIDGSLAGLKDSINSVVPGLMDADGKIVPASVGAVDEASVDAIMLLDGVGALTNKAELWGVVQDYQRLNEFIEKGGDSDDPPAGGLVPPAASPTAASPAASPTAASDDAASPTAASPTAASPNAASPTAASDDVSVSVSDASVAVAVSVATWVVSGAAGFALF